MVCCKEFPRNFGAGNFCCSGVAIQGRQQEGCMNRGKEQTLSLSGEWQFRAGENSAWQPIIVPGCWEQSGIPHDWEGPGYFRYQVTLPEAWRTIPEQRLWLRFGAVSYACQVWVNGTEVG